MQIAFIYFILSSEINAYQKQIKMIVKGQGVLIPATPSLGNKVICKVLLSHIICIYIYSAKKFCTLEFSGK